MNTSKRDNLLSNKKSFFRNIIESKWNGLSVIYFLMILSYSNIFRNGFVIDDNDFIVNWPFIRTWNNFFNFFTQYSPPGNQAGIYSPLKTFFHSLNYHLFGLNTLGYHVVSLLVHGLGIFLVYSISSYLSKRNAVAFFAALLFAIHPVNVEAIASMTANVDMIGIVFLFASFLFFIKYDEAEKSRSAFYVISVIFGLLSIFTHELAISLPLLILFYSLLISKKKNALAKKIAVSIPYFLIVAFYIFCKYIVVSSISRGGYIYNSFYLTMLIIIKAWLNYVLICFFPLTLTHNHVISKGIYSYSFEDFDKYVVLSQSLFDLRVLISLTVIIVLIIVAFKQYKKYPVITFCIGWFFICLLPVSNIIPSSVLFGERYLYPGMLGFCLLMGFLIDKYISDNTKIYNIKKSAIVIFILTLVILFFMVRTFTRNADWRNDITIMESAVRANPNSVVMRYNLGIYYSQYKQYDNAIKSLDGALKLREDPDTYSAKADVYVSMHNYRAAIDNLMKAISLRPDFPEAYYNLASIYASLSMDKEAVKYISKAIYYYKKQNRYKDAEARIKAFEDYFGLDIKIKDIQK